MNLQDKSTTYSQLKTALTNYFKPKVNKEYERGVFRRIRQEPGEKIDAYHIRLRQETSSCGFTDFDEELKFHVIQTTIDSKLRKQGLSNDALTLKYIIEADRNNELAQAQNIETERNLTMCLTRCQEDASQVRTIPAAKTTNTWWEEM